MQHAPVGPSSFTYLAKCLGRYHATRDLPEGPPGFAAERGILMHKFFEAIITDTSMPDEELTDEEWELVRTAVEMLRGMTMQSLIQSEVRVPVGEGLGHSNPELIWGTADVIEVDEVFKELSVIDLKTGRIPVSPNCDQLILYAIGAIHLYKVPRDWTVRLAILQPRVADIPLVHESTVDEIMALRASYRMQLDAMLDVHAPRTAGEEQCRWCRAAGNCVEHARWAVSGFDDEPDPKALTPARRRELIEHFLKQLQAYQESDRV
jgi:hypothetical protein